MSAFHRFFLRPAGDAVAAALFALALAFCGIFFKWDAAAFANALLALAAGIAFFALRSFRRTERQKATLDFINAYNHSEVVANGVRILNAWEKGDEHLSLAEPDKIAVLDFLNFFELLAIGLKNGIYDERMIMDAMETAIVRYYRRAEGFIGRARIRNQDVRDVAYEHFEALFRRTHRRLKKAK